MNAIRIQTKLDYSLLALPEVQPLLGKQVEIVIYEQTPRPPATEQDWANFFASVDSELIDSAVVRR